MEAAVAALLAPFLPYLLKAADRAAEEAAQKLGSQAGRYASALWQKLWPKVEKRESAKEAAEDVAARPDDEDAQAALRLQLRKLFAEDEELAREVAIIWEEARAANVTNVTVTASGDRSIAVGRDASGTFVTGDQPARPPTTD